MVLNMNSKTLSFFSLSLAIAALVAIYYALDTSVSKLPPEDTQGRLSNKTSVVVPEKTNIDYLGLVKNGLSELQAKQLIFQQIKDTDRSELTNIKDRFWESDKTAKTFLLQNKLWSQQRIRDDLIRIFGDSAWEDPTFSEVFKPLQLQFPFLSAKEQIAVHKVQVEHHLAALKSQKMQTQFLQSNQDAHQFTPLSVGFPAADVSEVLSEEAAYEYDLRTSMLAHQLRDSGVDFNEEKFRKTYDLLTDVLPAVRSEKPVGRVKIPESTLVDRRTALQNLLGSEDSMKVIVALDPEFRILQRKAAKLELEVEQLMTAYEISLETRKAILDAIRTKEHSPEIGIEMIRQAGENQWNRISQQLGEDIAKKMLGPTGRFDYQQPIVFPVSKSKMN